MWRTGGDLSQMSYDMWLNRLDLATDQRMRKYVGPGSFANPDFLEVGYSPRNPKGGHVMSLKEQRSMFTMWAALPGPLILSADLRPGASCGGIDDPEVMKILTNREVIAVNQDQGAMPMQPVRRMGGIEVWKKELVLNRLALVLFNRNASTVASVNVQWEELGLPKGQRAQIRDLWNQTDMGEHIGGFDAAVGRHEARIFTLAPVLTPNAIIKNG